MKQKVSIAKVFIAALADESPRVRAQALISLGRLNNPTVAKSILPLTARPTGSTMPAQRPLQNQPDPDRVVPHLAVRALVALNAIDPCLEALDGPYAAGRSGRCATCTNRKPLTVLSRSSARFARRSAPGILATLIRLYHREADYKGSWWGIRPDNTGPYYDRVEWEMSRRIGAVISAAVLDGDIETVKYLKTELVRHKVSLAGVPVGPDIAKQEKEKPIMLPKADPKNLDQIGNMTYETAARRLFPCRAMRRKVR